MSAQHSIWVNVITVKPVRNINEEDRVYICSHTCIYSAHRKRFVCSSLSFGSVRERAIVYVYECVFICMCNGDAITARRTIQTGFEVNETKSRRARKQRKSQFDLISLECKLGQPSNTNTIHFHVIHTQFNHNWKIRWIYIRSNNILAHAISSRSIISNLDVVPGRANKNW